MLIWCAPGHKSENIYETTYNFLIIGYVSVYTESTQV